MNRKPNARQRILDTASELFVERGYATVGINEIIERSETAKASFYHHFPSKEALCVTWLGETHERSEEAHKAILEADGDPVEKVEAYFDLLKKWLKTNDFRGCPYTNTAATATEAEQINEQVEQHKLAARDFFAELVRPFASSGNRALTLGNALFLLYSGATVESQNLRAVWPVDAARETARELCERERDG